MPANLHKLCRARFASALIVAVFTGACASSPAAPGTTPVPSVGPRELGARQQAEQVLNRLAFGPRPGDVAAVQVMGPQRWIDRQLHPESIPDTTLDVVMLALPRWNESARALTNEFPPQDLFIRGIKRAQGLPDNAPYILTSDDSARFKSLNDRGNRAYNQFQAAKVLRAQLSERQLLEVMTDFWENHFSVFNGKMPTRYTLLEYDRDVIRPNALGKFRTLLGAVAHSPAMLYYLDNFQSAADTVHMTLPEYRQMEKTGKRPPNRRRNGLNENYGRELLELHTLGVDGGYTQHDVIDAARALTGWTIDTPREGGAFIFREGAHDAEQKVVLGHTMRAGRGVEDGDELLDIVAHHPSTAKFIARKIARRLVSDSPSVALVERAADTFVRTDGDIREVIRTIVTSAEFFARANYRAKVKSPFELVVSARRLINASPDTSARSAGMISRLGEPLFGHLAPNGWPETGDQWINAGALLDRINFGVQVSKGQLPFAPIEEWPSWSLLSAFPFDRQVTAVIDQILGGEVSAETRQILVIGQNPLAPAPMSTMASASGGAAPGLRDLLGLAMGSPEFQRR